ncbi:transcription initiation factor TFIID subunit 9B [Patella vulgata]|uniref:transcription initiation factor TFIID subunit 9B n=1 Tax=Patella vulgata TaxID=6465 RepID=UPI00217FE4CB|nr:transcription initiation factor TFIID subunit 9B [Patella vulgata]
MAAPAKSTPRDAQIMAAILKDMGVLEYEPRIINQMLEFTYRYVTDILDDAKIYSAHANKKTIDVDDVKIAVQCRMDHSFTSPPPRDLLMEIARHKNNQQLPLIKPYTGPRLPPDRYCLSAPNYKLKSTKKPRIQFGLPMKQINQFGSGQRISLANLKTSSSSGNPTLTVVTKAVSQPTVTIISKPASSLPKPTIRVNTGSLGSTSLPKIITQSSSGTSILTPKPTPIQTSLLPTTITPTISLSSAINTPTVITNPLKRKLEDDDYDK